MAYSRGTHPNSRKKPTYDLNELLVSGVRNEGGCLIWLGAVRRDGYGVVNRDGRIQAVHRLVYQMVNGPIAPQLDVCHTCDVRLCYEPTHLFEGTRKENVQDCIQKSRHAFGSRHWNSRLTEEQVREILRLNHEGVSQTELGKRFGVRAGNISRIVSGRAWRHVSLTNCEETH